MVSQRANFLLNSINQQIDDKYKHSSEEVLTQTLTQEKEYRPEQERQMKERDALQAKYINQQRQRQNERIDTDKQRARDAERVLGREMYSRARQRVYGS